MRFDQVQFEASTSVRPHLHTSKAQLAPLVRLYPELALVRHSNNGHSVHDTLTEDHVLMIERRHRRLMEKTLPQL